MFLDSVIGAVRREIRGCAALALVDVASGAVLAAAHPRSAKLAAPAAACGELLAAPLARDAADGAPGFADDPADEVIVATPGWFHFFVRSRAHDGGAYVAICSASTGLGVVLADVRAAVAHLEAAA